MQKNINQKEKDKDKISCFVENELSYVFSELERKRTNCMFWILFFVFISVILCIYSFKLVSKNYAGSNLYNYRLESFFVFAITFFLQFLIGWFICSFNNKVKKMIFPKLLSFIGDFKEISFDSEKSREESTYIQNLKLFGLSDIVVFDDCIDGYYKNKKLEIREIHSQKRKSSVGNWKTIFQGILIKIPINKKLNGYTIITGDDLLFNKEEEIELFDKKYLEHFHIFSSDKNEAETILTLSFMEKLIEIGESTNFDSISLSFENNYLNIALHSEKEFFELPITKSVKRLENYKKIIADFYHILSIVDTLIIEDVLNEEF